MEEKIYIGLEEIIYYMTPKQIERHMNIDGLSYNELQRLIKSNCGLTYAMQSENSRDFFERLLQPEVYQELIDMESWELQEIDDFWVETSNHFMSQFERINDDRYQTLLLVQKESAKYSLYSEYNVLMSQISDTVFIVDNCLGGGAYGVALRTSDGILKITIDNDEFDKSMNLMNGNYDGLYYVEDLDEISIEGVYNYFPEVWSCFEASEINYESSNLHNCKGMISDLSVTEEPFLIIHKEYIEGELLYGNGEKLENTSIESEYIEYFDNCIETIQENFPNLEFDLHSGNCVVFPTNKQVPFIFFDF